MTVKDLCKRIELNQSVAENVVSFSENFDFSEIQPWLDDFRVMEKRKAARQTLQCYLGEDDGNFKILACMLKAAADLYTFYQQKQIEDEIYIATMGCFSRFINECYERTGKYHFDREWWTERQSGGHLFRIGELEYEIVKWEETNRISIHIPSDANFSQEACDESLARARIFFEKYFPQYRDCVYYCQSWLLAPELEGLLLPDSNILSFQKRFEITVDGKSDLEFLEWVFNTYETTLESLPENTRLQRSMKRFLLDGGMLSDATGILR